MAKYLESREPDEAQKLFWANIKAAMVNGSTQTRIEVKKQVEETKQIALDIKAEFAALFSGLGQAVAERKAKKK
jgi:hypothetical protein